MYVVQPPPPPDDHARADYALTEALAHLTKAIAAHRARKAPTAELAARCVIRCMEMGLRNIVTGQARDGGNPCGMDKAV